MKSDIKYRPQLKSERKKRVLNLCLKLVAKSFDLDEAIAKTLDISHSIAAKTMRDLRADGYLKYDSWRGMDASFVWHIYEAEQCVREEGQPFLPF